MVWLQATRAALFGGAGYVPDISSLQSWLEVAWKDGFDKAGAEQLGNQVQASRKWVGTTEAATLLRYFGIRTHIIDFQGACCWGRSRSNDNGLGPFLVQYAIAGLRMASLDWVGAGL